MTERRGSRYTLLTHDARQRLSIYATDAGKIVAVSDEDLYAHYDAYKSRGLKATILPPGTRSVKYFEAGHPLGDWPSEPKWLYDPSHITITDIPLKEYEVHGWHFYGRYLAAYGRDEWVFSDPYYEEPRHAAV